MFESQYIIVPLFLPLLISENNNYIVLQMGDLSGMVIGLFTVIFIFILSSTSSCQAHILEQQQSSALFVFGDSLFDAGNNNYIASGAGNRADFYPYGETFFQKPTGRFSDGRVVPDFIAEYAKLPLIRAYLEPGFDEYRNGVNFASAGAGVLVETHPGTIHLKQQLSYFKKVKQQLSQQLGDAEAQSLLMDSVYLFSVGGNDYFTFPWANPSVSYSSRREYIDIVIGNLTLVIQEIYDMGGRKFAFQNAGPLGCIPGLKTSNNGSGECVEEISAMAELHNMALSEMMHNFAQDLPGFKYSIFDYYGALGELVNHPSRYGFEEGKSACCGSGPYRGYSSCGGKRGIKEYSLCTNPNEYVWFDAAHTTESANRRLAQLIWSGPPHTTGPYNVQQLFQITSTHSHQAINTNVANNK